MRITIETLDDELVAQLTEGHTDGDTIPLAECVSVKYEGVDELTGFSVTPYAAKLIAFTVEHFDTVACGLLASWLYDKLKNRKAELSIGHDDPITISSESIRQALMKHKDR